MLEQLQQWIREEMIARRLGTLDEAAFSSGISQAPLSRIMSGRQASGKPYRPSPDTCRQLAVWLHRSEREVRYVAEVSVVEPEQFTDEGTVAKRRLLEVFDRLPPDEQERMIRRAEFEAQLLEEQRQEPRSESQTELAEEERR